MDRKSPESDFPIAIIGAGFAGLGMGIRLEQAGIQSFTIFERAAEVGGTWRDNTYPGAGCDVPSHVYSYSFEQNPGWSRAYAGQREIHQYILDCTDKHGLRPHIRFQCEIASAELDEAAGRWRLRARDGETFEARVLVLGMGGLSNPGYPNIEGLDSFEGPMFHTARWRHDVDLRGKRVAVIGSGASAIQVVPAIAPEVDHLSVFQRTPSWVMPKPDRPMKPWEKRLYRWFPLAQRLRRARLYWMSEMNAPFLISNRPSLKRMAEDAGRKHIEETVADPELRAKVTPDYRFGCKRVLISNDWYPTLQRDNTELVTESIERITPHGIRTRDGTEHRFDVIVLATGFQTLTADSPFAIRGLGGRDLAEDWKDGAEAYKGMTVSGYPNMFILVGPNTGPGHTSVLMYLEKQIGYTIQAIRTLRKRNLKLIDVKKEVQDRYNAELQKRMANTVWTSGCSSWYLAPNGKNTSLYPGFASEYRLRTRRFVPSEYRTA